MGRDRMISPGAPGAASPGSKNGSPVKADSGGAVTGGASAAAVAAVVVAASWSGAVVGGVVVDGDRDCGGTSDPELAPSPPLPPHAARPMTSAPVATAARARRPRAPG